MADAHDAEEAKTTEGDPGVMFDNIPGLVWTMAPSGEVE